MGFWKNLAVLGAEVMQASVPVVFGKNLAARFLRLSDDDVPFLFRWDDNSGGGTAQRLQNLGITAAGQGIGLVTVELGRSATDTAIAGRILLLSSRDWSTMSDRRAEWRLPTIYKGAAFDRIAFSAPGYVRSAGMRIVKTAQVATSTGLGLIDNLGFDVEAGVTYTFRAVLIYSADVTGGHRYAFNSDVTCSLFVGHIVSTRESDGAAVLSQRLTSMSAVVGQQGAVAGKTVIEGTFIPTVDGTFWPRFGQVVASGSSSVLAGSWCQLTEVNS